MINNEVVKKSLTSMQYEQLMTIKKELLHIRRVSNFFTQVKTTPYNEIHNDIITRIKGYVLEVSEVSDSIEVNFLESEKPYEFLIWHERINKHIDKILNGLKNLNRQISQYNEEHFNQYIPKPYLSRRYSSKALSTFIQKYIQELLISNNSSDQDENLFPSLFWDYRRGYELHHNSKISEYVIETPFYYYELPYLIPNLFHELNHIVLMNNKNGNQYESLRKRMKRTIEEYNKSNNLELNIGLSEEIVSDIYACDLFGESFVLSLFHTLVSRGMDNLYYNEILENIELINFHKSTSMSTMFNQSIVAVVEVHLRLKLVIQYITYNSELKSDDSELQDYINYIDNFLDFIFFKTDEPNDKTLYATYTVTDDDNLIDGFKNLSFEMDGILEELFITLKSHSQQNLTLSIDYKKIFLDIWKSRINKADEILHRNVIREGILSQIYSDDTLEYEPYELTYFKFSSHHKHNMDSIENYYTNFTGSNGENNENYECLGIYNNLSIRHKNKVISLENVKSFLATLDDNGKYDSDYYTYKIAMTKLHDGDEGSESLENFGAFIHLQLRDQEMSTIKGAFTDLKNRLNLEDVKYEIYKILGPSDYVVVLKLVKLSQIFKTKTSFVDEKNKFFRRTSTTIVRMNENTRLLENQESKSYKLISKIRLKYNIEIDDLKTGINTNCESILCVPGSMDIEIRWSTNDYIKVRESLNGIIEHISDVQTDYVKVL